MKLIRLPELLRMLGGVSSSWVWRAEKAGRFPSRIRLGPNCIGWREDEIRAWLDGRPRGPADRPDLAAVVRLHREARRAGEQEERRAG